ncbi:N-acetylmuramoyl-L-alanine amidase AmiB precursor [Cystobacter fuscus DSM 2262]|uniref:N-acetylmuramoyl-L-alanine amidase n=1 Tax=Cystobacter fuscus (strain ATCC 25194 / DSM 2262 / NBRC 100088 / M29) TaxID=1242864 RepID=S9QK20_CYSF2|nr:N-acetylmuramoyl-L-alanine amidase [Cystobacter fuscus]EPX56838.1 N-acetylmuramoyl-L-alanine amidase AmiB precursor [Cystobacter fuscus DSM 2262]
MLKPFLGLLLIATSLSAHGAESPPAPSSPTPALPGVPPTAPWPSASAPLTVAKVEFPRGFGRPRIYLDAGHGAPGNEGNSSVTCEAEETYTLRVARELARRLEATGHFQVKLSRREPGQQPAYPQRLQEAEQWRAALFLSLHSDARGEASEWLAAPERWCARNDAAPGYSVLYADDSGTPLVSRRLALARALARRMGEAGFLPYGGEDYVGLYATDPEQPGTFVSRHVPGRRIFVLRKPSMPSVIIETHHAWDFEEEARWREERTLEAFAAAVAQGLVDALTPK